jgi:hypothetical protein
MEVRTMTDASDSRGVHVPEGASRSAAPGEGLPRASSAATTDSPEWDGLPINIRIGRGEHGWWWAVYFGNGDIPGSLWGGAGTYGEIGECYSEAYGCYLRAFAAHPPRHIAEVAAAAQGRVGVGDLLLRGIHDNGGSDEYRPKREDESWYAWWQGYQNDVFGVDVQDMLVGGVL